MMTTRHDILHVFEILERSTGRTDFRLVEVVEAVRQHFPGRAVSSVRTHITSVMCANAPVHHVNHTDDLIRVSPGVYRRATVPAAEPSAPVMSVNPGKPWPWEGAVVAVYRQALEADGWQVVSQADTASRQQGIDLIAERHDLRRLVEVKGYPSTLYEVGAKKGQPKPTNPSTQARVWFASAIMSALVMAGDDPTAEVVIAVPDFATYRNLGRRLASPLAAAGVMLHLVSEGGAVETLT